MSLNSSNFNSSGSFFAYYMDVLPDTLMSYIFLYNFTE